MLIDNLLSPDLRTYRATMYSYHRNGLDLFSSDKFRSKQSIENSIIGLEKLFNKSIANYLIRLFFDAKVNEIVNLYSDGPKTKSFSQLMNVLQKISPNNSNRWGKIN